MVFHTPSEAILSDIIHEQSNHKIFGVDLSIVNSGVIMALISTIAFLLFVQLRTRREMNRLSQSFGRMGVTVALLSTAKGQVVQLKQPTTTTSTVLMNIPVPVIEYFQDNTVSLITTAVMFMLLLMVILVITRWLIQMKSYAYIEIRAGNQICLIKHKRLPDASRCFHIIASKPVNVVVVDCFLFGFLKFTGKTWKVEDNRTFVRSSLPRRVLLTRGMVKQVKSLLKDMDCQVGPVVVHTHEYVRRFLDPEDYNGLEGSQLV